MPKFNVALVHDYLREYGGAERVLAQLHTMFPEAPVYVAFKDWQAMGSAATQFKNWDIRETALTKLPFYKKLFSPYRVFAAWAFQKLDLSEFDLVISSTNAYMAKAVRASKPGSKHLSYIHTPPRALYGYSTRSNWRKNPFIKVVGEMINMWMRYVDYHSAQNPDLLIANSRTTQQRITKFYRRESVIVPPPVGLLDLMPTETVPAKEREYLLSVGRLVLSKHPELVVAISNQTGYPLKVVGSGVMLPELQAQAGPQVEFLGAVDDDQLAKLYQHAKLVIFPAEDEDFGIVPIEALGAGTPVIAHFSGEPRYTIEPGKTGELVESFILEEWVKTVQRAWTKKWNHQTIADGARQYSAQEFAKKINRLIAQEKERGRK